MLFYRAGLKISLFSMGMVGMVPLILFNLTHKMLLILPVKEFFEYVMDSISVNLSVEVQINRLLFIYC